MTPASSAPSAVSAPMRRKLVAGNWKMFGNRADNARLLRGVLKARSRHCDVLVCVPAPYLLPCRDLLRASRIALGAQNCAEHSEGAYTGEVSAAMLRDCGASWVIVGHSERRQLFAEDDARVATKVVRALQEGLRVIVCVGETLQEREAGQTQTVLLRQWDAVAKACAAAVRAGSLTLHRLAQALVIAYEPVWAVGTGHAASPQQAQEAHRLLRARVAVQSDWGQAAELAAHMRIVYGGSVKPSNAASFFSQPDIDGGLIGGASLKAQDFLAIVAAAPAVAPASAPSST